MLREAVAHDHPAAVNPVDAGRRRRATGPAGLKTDSGIGVPSQAGNGDLAAVDRAAVEEGLDGGRGERAQLREHVGAELGHGRHVGEQRAQFGVDGRAGGGHEESFRFYGGR